MKKKEPKGVGRLTGKIEEARNTNGTRRSVLSEQEN